MSLDVLSVYINDQPVTIRAGTLEFELYAPIKKTTPVITAGVIDNVSGQMIEKTQEIKFSIPRLYAGVDYFSFFSDLVNSSGSSGASLTLKQDEITYTFKSVAMTAYGTGKDDGEPFIEVTLGGTHIG